MQQNISNQLSLFLRKTVAVSIVPNKEAPQLQSNAREKELKYSEPNIILEDNTFYYRLWVEESPTFRSIQEFRKPASTEPKVIELKP